MPRVGFRTALKMLRDCIAEDPEDQAPIYKVRWLWVCPRGVCPPDGMCPPFPPNNNRGHTQGHVLACTGYSAPEAPGLRSAARV